MRLRGRRWANLYVNAILHLRIKDATAGFKAWKAATLRAIDLDTIRSNGYSFQVETNYRTERAGIRIAEVPSSSPNAPTVRPKMTLKVQLEYAAHLGGCDFVAKAGRENQYLRQRGA